MKSLILFFLIFFDYISKSLITSNLEENTFITILPFLKIVNVHNYGISFGLFDNYLSYEIILIIGGIVTLFVLYLLINSSSRIEKNGFFLIICGAISNLLDRLINEYVIDFIYMHYNNYYWPAFNFADIYISVGVMLLIYEYFIGAKKRN